MITKAWLGLIFVTVLNGFLLFISAGSLHYWQAWVFLINFFLTSSLITLYLIKKNPALLKRRLRAGPTAEKEKTQKIIMLLVYIEFFFFLIVPGLDYRFGWSNVPFAIVIFGNILVILGFYIVFLVYKENPFTSATIELADDQRVISTGPYSLVRHPMYAGSLILLIGMPLALGSYWGLVAFVALLPVLIWRLLDEEKFLAKNLPGYTEYQKNVRSRLIPGVF